jgi:hypothetical protein
VSAEIFTYTGGTQSFVVPAGVTKVSVNAVGAAGGLGRPPSLYRGFGLPASSSPALPSGWAAGDGHLVVCQETYTSTPTVTVPSGWTFLGSGSGLNGSTVSRISVWFRTAQSGDSAPAFSSTNGLASFQCYGFRDPTGASVTVTSSVVTDGRNFTSPAAGWTGPTAPAPTSGRHRAVLLTLNGTVAGSDWTNNNTTAAGGVTTNLYSTDSVPGSPSPTPSINSTTAVLGGITFTLSAGAAVTTPAGAGAQVQCDLSVTPGDVLRVMVGGKGQGGSALSTAAGGSNGGGGTLGVGGNGGIGGGGGGGATSEVHNDFAVGSGSLVRYIVAAGGGGDGAYGTGGTAGGSGGDGGTIGTNGAAAAAGTGNGGAGASGATGGSGGTGTSNGNSGTNGTTSSGGAGGNGGDRGGGGGAGYAGGGGGAGSGSTQGGGGGGGGSSLGTGVNETITDGVGTGDGLVIISWTAARWRIGSLRGFDRPGF